jgi:streptogramin lyase
MLSFHVSMRAVVSTAFAASLLFAGCQSLSSNPLPGTGPAASVRAAASRDHAPVFRTFEAGKTPGFHKGSVPIDIVRGPGGAMWFTDPATSAVGKITAAGRVTEYRTGLKAGARPYSIVAGGDGNLWFSDTTGAIGRVTPGGAIVEYSVTGLASGQSPVGIAAAAKAMWMAVPGKPSLLVRTDFAGNVTTARVLRGYELDGSLSSDASGNLWMMSHIGDIGIMLQRTRGGTWIKHLTGLAPARLPCCPNNAPKHMTIAADGSLWFSALYWLRTNKPGNVIGTTTRAGTKLFTVSEKKIGLAAYPSGITTLGDKIWFTGDDPFQVQGGLWSIDGRGTQRAYQIPYNPIGLASDVQGNLWFTAEAFSHPGQIVEATPQ